jgi:hypothetical protein
MNREDCIDNERQAETLLAHARKVPALRTPQYWLAELDGYGNPTLVDGSHDDAEGANRASYLIQSMKLGRPGRVFAVAKVELSECVPTDRGVNHEAVATINHARKSLGVSR